MKCFLAIFILFTYSLFYTFNFFQNREKVNEPVPNVNHDAISLKQKSSNDNKINDLPVAGSVKIIEHPVENMDIKTQRTPLTFDRNVKTISPRLSKEEIQKAKVVDIIPMNIDNKDVNIIVVEKDGKTYDASDGVRIYIPFDFDEFFKKKRAEK